MNNIVIVNRSSETGVSNAMKTIVRAIGKQLANDLAPAWGRMIPSLELTDEPSLNAAQIVLLDDPDQADALGYHDETPEGLPYGRVFTKPILDNGGTLSSGPLAISVTLSHEILEMIGDPAINYWADGDDGYSYAVELCDACQSEAYEIDGVSVSDFVLPAFFDADPVLYPSTRYDFLGLITKPFGMTDGGYQIRRRTGSSRVDYVYGTSLPGWVRAMKRHPAARSRKRVFNVGEVPG